MPEQAGYLHRIAQLPSPQSGLTRQIDKVTSTLIAMEKKVFQEMGDTMKGMVNLELANREEL